MDTIETDYLVVGAGAAGLAFTDALIDASDAEVVLVDRRWRAGGHWRDAYPFVRLHQPSAFYGVNSRRLGADRVDTTGPNAGLYERARGAEIIDYFDRVLDDQLLPSGRVRFQPLSDYVGDWAGDHRFVSRLSGEATIVRVRRRVVDARYLESSVPATHVPSFSVAPGVLCVPVNGLTSMSHAPTGYTVIGGGKTAMDAVDFLLGGGVEPSKIRWIRPRDAWLLDRRFQQPLDQVSTLIEGASLYLEAAARASDVADLFARLEACGQLLRLDASVEPTMYRCATVNEGELERLRLVEDVVRLGRVRHIGTDHVSLDAGEIGSSEGHVYVDCTADGLASRPLRTIFEPERITLEQVRTCQPTFNAALIGFIETLDVDDAQRNRLCPPNAYPDAATDWISSTLVSSRAEARWARVPEVATWLERSRLNGTSAVGAHAPEALMQESLTRLLANAQPAMANLERLRVDGDAGSAP